MTRTTSEAARIGARFPGPLWRETLESREFCMVRGTFGWGAGDIVVLRLPNGRFTRWIRITSISDLDEDHVLVRFEPDAEGDAVLAARRKTRGRPARAGAAG